MVWRQRQTHQKMNFENKLLVFAGAANKPVLRLTGTSM